MQVTIGGNRLGSGQKMQTSVNNYRRSTHNLSKKWKSSMQCGVLYPFYKKLVTRGDKFVIDTYVDMRTIPTVGPLFGSFKLQIDYFECPIRLYQALLHNNPTDMSLKMDKVMLPIIEIETHGIRENWEESCKFNNSSLISYLGIKGMGKPYIEDRLFTGVRAFQAVPILAYYDIFKVYYANKQEENAYVISGGTGTSKLYEINLDNNTYIAYGAGQTKRMVSTGRSQFLDYWNKGIDEFLTFNHIPNNWLDISINYNTEGVETETDLLNMPVIMLVNNGTATIKGTWKDLQERTNGAQIEIAGQDKTIKVHRNRTSEQPIVYSTWQFNNTNYVITDICVPMTWEVGFEDKLKLEEFQLNQLDEIRYNILSNHMEGVPYIINNAGANVIDVLTNVDNNGKTLNIYPLNGLVIKTYQNDIFNNWLNTEWIEGIGGLAELTNVSVDENGKFSMDALNFAQKMYNMLNRIIAGTDGTYEGYLDAAYEKTFKRSYETPIWIGGFSREVVFDEIVQNAPGADGESPLGTLGGRGRLADGGNGHFTVNIYEPGYIIGIVSLTPRINYAQGNDWDMTDVWSIDDIHKPGLDGIGYQDLLGERMAWFDAHENNLGEWERTKIGKLPSWLEYMTDVDSVHGDFATPGEDGGYMALTRNYEMDENGYIKDATTYIDPKKYNYVFAYSELDAQNFWVEIVSNIKARRLMSGRIIPHV